MGSLRGGAEAQRVERSVCVSNSHLSDLAARISLGGVEKPAWALCGTMGVTGGLKRIEASFAGRAHHGGPCVTARDLGIETGWRMEERREGTEARPTVPCAVLLAIHCAACCLLC